MSQDNTGKFSHTLFPQPYTQSGAFWRRAVEYGAMTKASIGRQYDRALLIATMQHYADKARQGV